MSARVPQDLTTPGPATCLKQPGGIYTRLYHGTQRAPRYPDEAQAVCVVVLMGAERAVIRPTHDRERMEVAILPPALTVGASP